MEKILCEDKNLVFYQNECGIWWCEKNTTAFENAVEYVGLHKEWCAVRGDESEQVECVTPFEDMNEYNRFEVLNDDNIEWFEVTNDYIKKFLIMLNKIKAWETDFWEFDNEFFEGSFSATQKASGIRVKLHQDKNGKFYTTTNSTGNTHVYRVGMLIETILNNIEDVI